VYTFGTIMLLNEFFGKNIDPVKNLQKGRDDNNPGDELFWYIIDHDKLHKDYFFPIAANIAKHKGDYDRSDMVKKFMPMVVKGCKEFYSKKKMKGVLGKLFSKELRQDMCERLLDHYREDIIKGKYKIGM
jgi:hypothetical protein